VIGVEALGDLVLLRLDRTDRRNALTHQLIEELTQELTRVAADEAIRGVILAGAGPSFCAGVDLHEFGEGTPDSARQLIGALAHNCASVRRLPQPVA
jgi:enoyl-CoA hydratase/carnithine racemase